MRCLCGVCVHGVHVSVVFVWCLCDICEMFVCMVCLCGVCVVFVWC